MGAGDVVIVDYDSGNLHSAEKAAQRAAAAAGLTVRVSAEPEHVAAADRVILPGVGAFGDCAEGLAKVDGMVEALEERVLRGGRPFLGICVGMQLMASAGTERGRHEGLGWIDGVVSQIEIEDKALKVPHMGWNVLRMLKEHPFLADLPMTELGAFVYFVHSYVFHPEDRGAILAETDYGGAQTAIIGRDNLLGVQFHPEKSHDVGLKLLTNFMEWRP